MEGNANGGFRLLPGPDELQHGCQGGAGQAGGPVQDGICHGQGHGAVFPLPEVVGQGAAVLRIGQKFSHGRQV